MRVSRRCLLMCLFVSLTVLASVAAAPAPSLELKLDAPQALAAAGPGFGVTGDFGPAPDGKPALGLGKTLGPAVPAAPFCGPTGTVAFTVLHMDPAPEHRMFNRHVVTLRLAGRGFFGFYFCQTSRVLYMSYKDLTEGIAVASPGSLEAGKAYRLAATWDGTTVCFYLDGRLIGTQKQGFPATWPDYARIKLGAYEDGSAPVQPWGANDVFLRDLRIWKEPLNPMQIAADAGVEAVTAESRFPPFLAVPQTAAPAMDGKLSDPAWQQAASFVSLLDATTPAKSLWYPENRPLLCHDGQNLYVGFETIFPAEARLVPGEKRGAVEPDVWPVESFELYLEVAGKVYRFAGNAAGGYCESVDTATEWNGQWEYASTLEFRIDNRTHWQGEIKVPFATLGLTEPVGRDLRLNFCRTWRCFDEVGITHLQAATQNYGDQTHFATIRPLATAEGGIFSGSTDPSFGHFRQQVALHSARGGAFTYTLKALNTSGDGQTLVEEQTTLPAGGRTELKIDTAIHAAAAERLLFQVSGPGAQLLMRQLVPFRLSEEYLDVTPVFGRGQIVVKPRMTMLKAKHSTADPVVRLLAPDGRVLQERPVANDDPLSLTFDPQSPAGAYTVELASGKGEALRVYTGRQFAYTGPGNWVLPPMTAPPPPFEDLRAKQAGRAVDINVWGRLYRFDGAVLPSAIQTQGRALLAAPVQLLVGGRAAATERVALGERSALRADLSGQRETAEYDLRQHAWVEYDGVFYHRFALKAVRDLGPVTLSVSLPAAMAKFAHATASGFGGGGRQNLWLDQNHELPYHPSVWMGNEEGGLAWFAESASDWRTKDPRPIKFIREGKATRLQVTFADQVPAGTELALEFGLLATPVKPLPANYPLNTFSDNYSVHLNLPAPRAPTTYSGCGSWEGAGFFDLPLGDPNSKVWQWLKEHFERHEQHRGILTPYTASMMIPAEYPEVASRVAEWQLSPASHLSYQRDGVTRPWYWLCPASEAADFFAWKVDELLGKVKLRGIYLDFGPAYRCNNALHGCRDRYALLAQRRLYQRLAATFARHGVTDHVICVHNSECVQWPTFTHVTHFLNGEGLRQMSSTTFHNGKDLQDTYTRLDFACEHSSLPYGVTSSIYVPTDPLLKQFGGGDEDQELYRFRMTKAALAGSLVHNTLPSMSRLHHGWFDKIVRFYDDFGVPQAEFLPYWRNQDMVRVVQGKDIFVSLYRSRTRPEVLAVIAHMSPEHLDQEVAVSLAPRALGVREWMSATELLTSPDPAYDRLYPEPNRIRMPIKLGDFGIEHVRFAGQTVTLNLKFHSVALVKFTGRR